MQAREHEFGPRSPHIEWMYSHSCNPSTGEVRETAGSLGLLGSPGHLATLSQNKGLGAGEMAQWLEPGASVPELQRLVPSTSHQTAHNHL